ncbi:MAG: helix-turn-helix domain-containing protein [Solirubrobacteraceae bacterium]
MLPDRRPQSDLECRVLLEDPELADTLAPQLRALAIERCTAPLMQLGRGAWTPAEAAGALQRGIGLLVLDGLLLRRVGVDGRFGAELLGEGDLLRPWQGPDSQAALAQETGWRVLTPARIALLDEAVALRFADYPQLTGTLVGRALERTMNLAVNMAIVHQARVIVRLQMLFWHFAARWGRVGSAGIVLPVRLTHTVLADLVAARRPTVTSSLSELARQGTVRPRRDGWLLTGEPPGELLEIQDIHGVTVATQGP